MELWDFDFRQIFGYIFEFLESQNTRWKPFIFIYIPLFQEASLRTALNIIYKKTISDDCNVCIVSNGFNSTFRCKGNKASTSLTWDFNSYKAQQFHAVWHLVMALGYEPFRQVEGSPLEPGGYTEPTEAAAGVAAPMRWFTCGSWDNCLLMHES